MKGKGVFLHESDHWTTPKNFITGIWKKVL